MNDCTLLTPIISSPSYHYPMHLINFINIVKLTTQAKPYLSKEAYNYIFYQSSWKEKCHLKKLNQTLWHQILIAPSMIMVFLIDQKSSNQVLWDIISFLINPKLWYVQYKHHMYIFGISCLRDEVFLFHIVYHLNECFSPEYLSLIWKNFILSL